MNSSGRVDVRRFGPDPIGQSTGDSRAEQAAEKAISSPLLETSMEGARGVLLSIAGPIDMTLHEVSTAASIVADHSDGDANIIFGTVMAVVMLMPCPMQLL